MVKNYSTILIGRKRACIVAKRSLNLTLLTHYGSNNTTVAVLDENGQTNQLLASTYMLYDKEEPPSTAVRALVLEAKIKGCHLVMGCKWPSHPMG